MKSFIFPFQHIPKGQKIIIYGAGAVGREYYRQLETSGWCSHVHITDKYNITSFPPTQSLDCIISEDYDVLLIALENHTVAEQVRKMLLDLGVLESKILWFSPNVDSLDESYRKPILWERLSQNLLKESSSDRVYLMNTPDHGNLGDHALAIAGTNELKKRFPKAEVCEVTGCQWDWFKGKIIPIVQKQEDIFINAGGSMGSLWKYEDSRIKDIIRSFPDNRIVILPQSIYFDADTSASELALEKNFYETYKNVHIIFRERNSYNWFRENIISADGRSSLEPDLALKIKINIESKREKNGVLCCFREDHESVLSNLFIENLCRFFNETEKIDYKFISTVVDHMILPEDREAELSEFLRRVAEARLVITDRLHAMVFAKLVGTPCIALDNISKKVSGVYEWISDCPYVICTKEDIVTPKLIMEYYEKGETKWV